MAIGSTLSVGLIGLKAFIVQVQAFISPGLPYFSIIGLPDASLSEARERVKSACQATGFGWPQTRVTVNMSPAAMPKRGSSHDLLLIFYARVILSERRQRVHTFTFLVSPSTIARTLWMFGFQVLFVRM